MPNNEKYAKCPKCNGKIIDKNDHWVCENLKSGNCNFKIKNTLNNEKIDLELLINFQKTRLYNYFIRDLSLK